jgi:hypothetical protein
MAERSREADVMEATRFGNEEEPFAKVADSGRVV